MPANAPQPITRVDFPEGSRFKLIEVAGGGLRAPELVRMDSGPSEPLDYLTRFWSTPREDRVVEIRRLRNVYVTDPGLVFDADRRLYEPTAPMHSEKELAEAVHQLDAALEAGAVIRREGVSLLCGKAGMFNYGHWMVEMLPLAFLTRDLIVSEGWSVFLPHMYPWMQPVIRESLTLLGIPDHARFENDGRPVWFEELVVVTGVARMGSFYLPVTVEAMLEMSRDIPAEGSDRLWMSRQGRARTLMEEAEVCARLTSDGWGVMDPGQASLRSQIAASKAAQHMAGVCGAGLTNLGFLPPTGRVTSFAPNNMGDVFFWSIAANRDLPFREVRCPVTPPTDGSIPWDATLEISADEVLSLLR